MALGAAAWGCDGADVEAVVEPLPQRRDAVLPEAPPPIAITSPGEPPASGEYLIAGDRGRVSIYTTAVPRARVLIALAREMGFEIELSRSLLSMVSIHIEDREVAEAIALLVDDEPYTLVYEPVPETGGHRLARLHVGPLDPSADVTGQDEQQVAVAAQRARLARDRQAGTIPDQDRLLEESESETLEVRITAVNALVPAGEGLERILLLAETDPDASVRVAAVQKLEQLEAPGVASVLLARLEDSDRGVVIAAIGALEWQDDPRVLGRMRTLLDDPRIERDPELAERVQDAIDWLED